MLRMKNENKAIVALVLGHFIWGVSFVFSKICLTYASPFVYIGQRFTIAISLMGILIATGRVKVSFKGKKLGQLALLGLFEPVLYFVCENYGILYTSATFSGMMIAMIPISSMALAALFLKERPSFLQILFSVISVAGVVMVSVKGTGGEGAVPTKGVLLMLGAVLTASGYQLMTRKLSGEFTAFERTVFMFLEGAVAYVTLMLLENFRQPMAMLEPLMNVRYVVALLFQGTLSSVGAYFFQNYAMTYLPINRVAPFANMTTAVSLFAGVVFLHEPFGLVMIPASLMILGGVWGVQHFAPKEE